MAAETAASTQKLPAGQVAHAVRPMLPLYVPGRQLTHPLAPVSGWELPALQFVQLPAPAAEYLPAAQATACAEATVQYEPEEQPEGALLPAGQYMPEEHSRQLDAPPVDWNRPPAQSEQFGADWKAENWPGLQLVQPLASAAEKVPTAQGKAEDRPVKAQ